MTTPTDPARQSIITRTILTGLASGGEIQQFAAILGEPLPAVIAELRTLREQYGAKTNAHLVAKVTEQRPCRQCGLVPADRSVAAPPPMPPTLTGSLCPDCGDLLRHTEGCEKCPCGYTRC